MLTLSLGISSLLITKIFSTYDSIFFWRIKA